MGRSRRSTPRSGKPAAWGRAVSTGAGSHGQLETLGELDAEDVGEHRSYLLGTVQLALGDGSFGAPLHQDQRRHRQDRPPGEPSSRALVDEGSPVLTTRQARSGDGVPAVSRRAGRGTSGASAVRAITRPSNSWVDMLGVRPFPDGLTGGERIVSGMSSGGVVGAAVLGREVRARPCSGGCVGGGDRPVAGVPGPGGVLTGRASCRRIAVAGPRPGGRGKLVQLCMA